MISHPRRGLRSGVLALLLVATTAVAPAEARGGQKGCGQDGPPGSTFHTEVPEHLGSVVPGRPTKTSITGMPV